MLNRSRDRSSGGTGGKISASSSTQQQPERVGPRATSSPGRGGLVRREALFERLSSAPPGGVALVCAPAGSGKTVLLRSWAEESALGERVAWVALDRGEQDGQRFLISMVDALADTIDGEIGIKRIKPTPNFLGEVVVEELLSDLESLDDPLVLVIDDLHELQAAEALTWLELFLARMPPKLRLVLGTRQEPELGLHRLRLADRLVEVRGSDLCFSQDETRALLEASDIGLSDEAVALLQERTEGWVAGLRLAAISLAGHPEPDRFVREFCGSERTVAGYLLAEVLERQPAEVRDLLLRTSILDRVSGPLADFLTGSSGSEQVLQALEDANAFVTSLDVARSWFHYHHLFADLLRLELRRTDPASIGALHRKAASWHESHGYPMEAIRHAQRAEDWQHAGRLLADNYLTLLIDGRNPAVRELLGAFPPGASAEDAELALASAATLITEAALEEVPAYIDLAQQLADTVRDERRPRFDLHLATIRLALARRRADLDVVQEAMASMEAALAAPPATERDLSDAVRAVALQELGIAELWSSRFEQARRDLEQALSLERRAGLPFLQVSSLGHLGIACPCTGSSLAEGLERSEEAVRIAEEHGWMDDPVVGTGLATGSLTLLWLGRFDEVERWLARARRAMRPDGEPGTELLVHEVQGVLRLAQGQVEEALACFREAERMQTLLAGEHAFAVATKARLLQAQAGTGDVTAARAALAGLSAEERNASAMRIAEAAICLAEGDAEQAVEVLAPVIEGSAPALHRPSAIAEAAVLDAVARDALGDIRAAEDSLERALDLAESDGIILPFALAPVASLLERHPRHRTSHSTLLLEIADLLSGSWTPRGEPEPLREELSEAEIRVVRYLPSNLKAPEIAAELFVSPNTVRTHMRHIYSKLDAHSRKEAVDRARELGLISSGSRLR
jgi:LuxR family transcriptional regulator, maltose regulon positive regulatory protein